MIINHKENIVQNTQQTTNLEGPEEVGDFGELGTDCEDLVNHIFDTDDVVFTETLFNLLVAHDRNAFLVHFNEASFVH